jgi:transposase
MKNTSLIKPEPIQKAKLIKLAVDVHANSFTFCRQLDNAQLQPPQKMNPAAFVSWAVKQKSLAERVVVCYESGPFGFVLARELMAKGVECIVMAAQQLDERRKRVQTDKLDTLQIASRLDRYLAGNTKALCAVKIPTVEQERKRSEGRQRGQLRKTRHQLAAQGRSLLVLNGYTNAETGWWREDLWSRGGKCWPAAVVTMLARWRAVLLSLEEQLHDITQEVEQSLPEHLPASLPKLPIGLGALTWVLLSRELLEWDRFKNRREVGSFTGLVASESSSGKSQRQGHITKVGNPRVRALLVELVWRLVHFQPEYRVVKKWRPRMLQTRSKCQRKKMVVAMGRETAVDLWRLATGQTTLQKLGLKVAQD